MKGINDIFDRYMDMLSEIVIKSYGFYYNSPYDGMFHRRGKYFRYTINYTKKVAYSLDTTIIRRETNEIDMLRDPLPQLMGFGTTLECGEWVGDIVGPADTLPDDILLLDTISLR